MISVTGPRSGRRWRVGREGTPMLRVVPDLAGIAGSSVLDELVREGARRMLAAALEAEVARLCRRPRRRGGGGVGGGGWGGGAPRLCRRPRRRGRRARAAAGGPQWTRRAAAGDDC